MTVGLGALGRGFMLNYVLKAGDYVLHRIPFVNTIYKTSQDVIKTMFAPSSESFKKVVLVPFPNPNVYTIGLITRENLPSEEKEYANKIAVFIPTTPNPTSGFFMLFDEKDIYYLDMTVENAFKFIISCGVLPIPFKVARLSRPDEVHKVTRPSRPGKINKQSEGKKS